LDVADDRASSCSFGDCVPYETLDQIHGQPEILKSLYGAAARDRNSALKSIAARARTTAIGVTVPA
jgi:hypothetical protein